MTARSMVWDGMTQSLALGIVACATASLAAIVFAGMPAPPPAARPLASGVVLLAAFPLVNAALVYASGRRRRPRVWFLGLATLAGVAAGVALLWNVSQRTHPAGPFTRGERAAVEAVAMAVSWLVAAGGVLLRPRHAAS